MPEPRTEAAPEGEDLTRYAGRWVALVNGRVVGQGGTPDQARLAARLMRFKEIPEVKYVATPTALGFPPLLARLAQALPETPPVYLVGGAVRDALLSRPQHDMDFVLGGDVMGTARTLANRLGAAFYPLDETRSYARVVLQEADGARFMLDFAPIEGPDLESDLRRRDFTFNAMAVSVHDLQRLFDPLGGAADLLAKRLRACAPDAFTNDPVRILRAVRQAAAFGLKIMPETRTWMRQAVPQLEAVSPERLRDELLRMLGGRQPAAALRALDLLGALPYVLPELPPLKGVGQSPPHTLDVWEHTLDVVARLEALLDALAPDYDPDQAGNLVLGLAVLRLGRYRQQIAEHLGNQLNPDRSARALLFLAALYHDAGKPPTRSQEADGRVRFLGHEQLSERLAATRAQHMHLSNAELERLTAVVRHHMRPLLLAQMAELVSRKAVYRFFRATGPAGVEVCLLSLADMLGTYANTLRQEDWAHLLDVVRTLLEAWWEKPEESVAPLGLLNGRDLIEHFQLQPGPQIGRLLEAIREAQAVGQISTREQALELAASLLDE